MQFIISSGLELKFPSNALSSDNICMQYLHIRFPVPHIGRETLTVVIGTWRESSTHDNARLSDTLWIIENGSEAKKQTEQAISTVKTPNNHG